MAADASENAEHRLHEQRRLDQAAIEEMLERVEMADIIALDLETGVIFRAGSEDVFNVSEGVLEHALLGPFQIRLFPVVFEVALVARDHRVEPEIHRAHVERSDLRLEGRGRLNAFLDLSLIHISEPTRLGM